jgi:hypothetical protein
MWPRRYATTAPSKPSNGSTPTEDRSYADGVLVELPVAEDSELLPDLLMPSGVLRTGPLAGCDLITSLTTGAIALLESLHHNSLIRYGP